MSAVPTTPRDHLVVLHARAHTTWRQLARRALQRRDRRAARGYLRHARRSADFVRGVAAECELELEFLVGRSEPAEPIPVGDALDSDLAAFEAALEQLA